MKVAQLPLPIAFTLSIISGCGGAPTEGDPTPEGDTPIQQTIYNGQAIGPATNAGFLGVPELLIDNHRCSAVVYNKYWLITAAHCFDPAYDPQNDWVYWNSDIPRNKAARYLQTSASNGAGQLNILAGFRSPDINQDTALVLLDPTSSGVYMPTLQAQTTAPTRYSNGHLVIYGSTNASLRGTQTVIGYGWGASGSSGSMDTSNGSLNRGWKNVTSANSLYYFETKFNNAGTNCLGDSGGPDFWWDGGGFQLTGIHGTGDSPCNGSGGSRNNGAQAFRTWVRNTAATVPMNGTVAPEELWAGAANNASDYNPRSYYSSLSFPSSANTRGIWLQTYLASAGTVNRVNIRARCAGFFPCVRHGFPATYTVHVWNGAWNYSGTFTQQPDDLGVVSLSIPQVNNATAVRVSPDKLGIDPDDGRYYFELAELQPADDR